ncbi:MAG: hypothetical protein HYY60_02030 [Parcubacteria group bacterium]|nr:hypothetical protein [Parcubacteria group bacterium]
MEITIVQVAPDAFDILGIKDGAHRLQVGDLVCTCKYQHLKISEIFPERFLKQQWRWLLRLMPRWYWWEDLVYRLAPSEVYDLMLKLEDGSLCSFRNCCNVVPHKWEHPSQEEIGRIMSRFNSVA